MRTVVGIFTAPAAAERAAEQLRSAGFPADRISVLCPGHPERARTEIPIEHGEQPGMGTAIGTVAGVGAGAPIGAAIALLIVPGVGPVLATGLAASALFGLGGALVGGAVEQALTEGVPKDEVFVYEDALRQGRIVVVALADDEAQAETARGILTHAGAESIDAAREHWWIGLRSAERERYVAEGQSFERDEPGFRRGFEAALRVGLRGKAYREAESELRTLHPDVYNTKAFQRGYERGLAYWQGLQDRQKGDAA